MSYNNNINTMYKNNPIQLIYLLSNLYIIVLVVTVLER
jgi:hypothetical protein